MNNRTKKTLLSFFVLSMVLLISIFVQMTTAGNSFNKDIITIWVFDVGQGDAIFIDAPNAQVLIDGGRNSDVVEKLSEIMPFWDRKIDLIVNSHPHADHVTGLVHVLERYFVKEVWTSGQNYNTDVFAHFEDLSIEKSVQFGDVYELGAGAILTVLWPDESFKGARLENVHDANVALLFEYGETSMLFTGDMEMEVERQILDQLDHVDILKVGHHGSLTSTSMELLLDISPNYAVIPVGENDYGHPHPAVVDRLENLGVVILRTDLDGDVRITTDGGEPKIKLFNL